MKNFPPLVLSLLVGGAIFLPGLAPLGLGASYDLGVSGNWTSSTTWNPNLAGGPTSGDSIEIRNISGARTVTLDGAGGTTYTVAGLSYNETDAVVFQNFGSGQKYLTVTGNLTKDGAGALSFLQTANSSPTNLEVDGSVLVNSGTLNLGTGSNAITAIAFNGLTSVASGAVMNLGIYYGSGFAGHMGTFTLDGTLNLSGGNSSANGTKFTYFAGLSGSGSVNTPTDFASAKAATLVFEGGSGSSIFSGGLNLTQSPNTTFSLIQSGSGRQALTGVVAYSGSTAITGGGVLQFGNNTVTTIGAGNIALSGGTSANGGSILGLGNSGGSFARSVGTGSNAIQMAGYAGFAAYGIDQTVTLQSGSSLTWGSSGFLTGSSALVLGHSTATNKVTLTNDLNLGNASRSVLVHKGSAAVDGVLSGVLSNGSLVKDGDGTLQVTGNNAYAGGTTISAGTLLIGNSAGSATGTGAVSLAAGATLGGGNAAGTTGFISGLVTTGGTTSMLAPGTNGIGTLNLTGGLSASAGATFNFELGTSSDLINTGALTGSAAADGLIFNLANGGGLTAGVAYTLLDFTSATGLDYSDLMAGNIASGFALDTSFGNGGFFIDSTNGLLQVQFAAVPEPSALALGGLVLPFLARYLRRRFAA